MGVGEGDDAFEGEMERANADGGRDINDEDGGAANEASREAPAAGRNGLCATADADELGEPELPIPTKHSASDLELKLL